VAALSVSGSRAISKFVSAKTRSKIFQFFFLEKSPQSSGRPLMRLGYFRSLHGVGMPAASAVWNGSQFEQIICALSWRERMDQRKLERREGVSQLRADRSRRAFLRSSDRWTAQHETGKRSLHEALVESSGRTVPR
jgi:hypothetical protein